MQYEYTKNYIKIYFWRFFSIISGFLSLLVVVPHLSNDLELYGIYSFCISFTLYLTYSDIGFLNAGQKYAAEEYIKNNLKGEIEILGFTGAILLLMVAPFTIAMIYFYFNPDIIIKNLSEEGQNVARSMFLILATVLPFQIIIQRLVQSILIIRVKDYISLKIDVIFNLLKIGSVFFFFTEDLYLVVEYYLFINTVTIASSFIIMFIIKKKEDYDFLLLLKSIKLRKKEYLLTKKLAYSSLFLTLGWIIYYELDLIIIGKWFGRPEDVAIYAIGFTFLNFLRTLWNSVFSPFAQRFNHFVGLNSDMELKKIIRQLIDYTFPLCIIVTLVLFLASEKITYYWVGLNYQNSILIMQILILGTVFSFVNKPASFYFTAKTKYKFIYLQATLLPVSFFMLLNLLLPNYGLIAVSISKSFTIFIGFIISMIGIHQIYNPLLVMQKWFINLLVVCVLIYFSFQIIFDNFFLSQEKSTISLITLILVLIAVIVVSYVSLILTKQQQRKDLKTIFTRILNFKFIK